MNPVAMANDNSYLGREPVGKLLFRLALPTVIAQIVNMLYNIVDRIYIGHLPDVGGDALTGLGVCAPLIYIIAAFAALVYYGSSARASMNMGRGEPGTAERIMGNSFVMLCGVSVMLTIVLEIFASPLLYIFGASDVTIQYALPYFRIYALGNIFVCVTLGLNSFITAQGFTSVSMVTVVIGALCNVVLDAVFIYGFHMGVQGAALATIISQAVSAVWVICFLRGKKTVLKLRTSCFRLDWKLMLGCLALGVSPFIMQSTEGIVSICFNSSLRTYGGDTAVGAMTVLSTIRQCLWLVLSGLTQAALPIISYNFGARSASRVKGTFRILAFSCLVVSVVLGIACEVFPYQIAGLMTDDQVIREYSAWAMRIYCATFCIFGIQSACQQTFIGIGNAKTSMFLALLRKVILLIPLIYLLPLFLKDQAMAVYLAEPVADVVAVTVTVLLFRREFHRAVVKLEEDPRPAAEQG